MADARDALWAEWIDLEKREIELITELKKQSPLRGVTLNIEDWDKYEVLSNELKEVLEKKQTLYRKLIGHRKIN